MSFSLKIGMRERDWTPRFVFPKAEKEKPSIRFGWFWVTARTTSSDPRDDRSVGYVSSCSHILRVHQTARWWFTTPGAGSVPFFSYRFGHADMRYRAYGVPVG
jgi:hypothetical protein